MRELVLSPTGRRYGYRKDVADHRDLGAMRVAPRFAAPVAIPSSIDLEQWCGPVKDQGQLGACTAFAGCGMREFLARKHEDRWPVLSPLFLYYKEREFDGDLAEGDAGSFGRTSVHVMNQFGVCLESEDAYSPVSMNATPTAEQLAEALTYKAGAYHRLSTVDDMKACLASGYVFVVGFTVFESFESKWSVPAYMPLPQPGERELGGHEVLFIGFSDDRQAFKVRNSWGSEWGNTGNFWFPFAAAADSRILQDSWMQHLGPAW